MFTETIVTSNDKPPSKGQSTRIFKTIGFFDVVQSFTNYINHCFLCTRWVDHCSLTQPSGWFWEHRWRIRWRCKWHISFLWQSDNKLLYTLPETNMTPENRPSEKKLVFQPFIFRSYVSFREGSNIWQNVLVQSTVCFFSQLCCLSADLLEVFC